MLQMHIHGSSQDAEVEAAVNAGTFWIQGVYKAGLQEAFLYPSGEQLAQIHAVIHGHVGSDQPAERDNKTVPWDKIREQRLERLVNSATDLLAIVEAEMEDLPCWHEVICEAQAAIANAAVVEVAGERGQKQAGTEAGDERAPAGSVKARWHEEDAHVLNDGLGVTHSHVPLRQWWCTFGIGQGHEGGYHVVEAKDRAEAHAIMHERFGSRYSMMYDSPEEAGVEEYGLKEVGIPDPGAADPQAEAAAEDAARELSDETNS